MTTVKTITAFQIKVYGNIFMGKQLSPRKSVSPSILTFTIDLIIKANILFRREYIIAFKLNQHRLRNKNQNIYKYGNYRNPTRISIYWKSNIYR